jgi:Gpi18-like mannosyltransferase
MPRAVSRRPLLALICAALALRAALTPLYAYLPNRFLDEGFWKFWMQNIHDHGVLNIFRTTDTDYVGYHWVLWGLAWIYGLIGGPYTQTAPALHVLVKAPPILFDVALIVAVYHATAALLREEGVAARSRLPLIAAAVIAFHPAVVYDSAVWSQTDSAITAAMLGAIVLAANRRAAASGVAYALGFAVKPHPIIIVHLLGLALRRSCGWRGLAIGGGAAALVLAAVLAPWVAHGDLARIAGVYHELFTVDHHRLSEMAWNVWWISDYFGDPRPGTVIAPGVVPLTYRTMALALSSTAALLAFAYAWRAPGLRGTLIAASYQAFAFYALPTGTHERYLFPLLGLLLPVALTDRRWLWLYVPASGTFLLNLLVVAPPVAAWSGRWAYDGFTIAFAVANMAMFTAFSGALLHGALAGVALPQRRQSAPERVARGVAPERVPQS